MAGAEGQGAHGGVDDVGAGFDPLEDGHRRQAGGVVAVDVHRDLDGGFQLPHQLVAGVGGQQAGHILDADGVGTHLLKGLGVGGEGLVGVHRAEGVADAALDMGPLLVGRLDGGLQVAGVVQRVEDADDVDAIGHRLLHEVLHRVVGVGAVAQHVLAAEQHLQLLVGQLPAQDAQPVPRVLVQKADAAVEGRAAPALHREVGDLIHFGQDGTHLIHGHAGGQQGLMGVPQDHLGDLDGLFGHSVRPPFSSA